MPGRIRILFVSGVWRWGGGAEAVLLDLASRLDRSQFEAVLATSADDSLAGRFRDAGLPVHVLPSACFPPPTLRGAMTRRIAPMLDLLRAERFDLVHTNCDRSIIAAIDSATPHGIPVVCHLHDMIRPWFRRNVRTRLQRASAVVVVSSTLRAFCVERGLNPGNLHVVYNGVDPAPFHVAVPRRSAFRRPLGLGAAEVAIGVIGNLSADKGQEHLLLAAAEPALRALPIRIFLVGEDWTANRANERRLRRIVAERGLEDRTTFLGFRDDVPALLAAFDIIAAPFRLEAFGRVVVESMCAGKPVVAYRRGALPELVRDGREGLLVPPGDIAALADALRRLVLDPGLRAELGTRGRERAGSFTPDRQVGAMQALYENVVRRTPSRR
ncbi:MAG TPA: glycosyltransferase family 4 protein [Longimicrobiales bacterium]